MAHAPVVLRVETPLGSLEVLVLPSALAEPGRPADDEVGQTIAGEVAVEEVVAVLKERVDDVVAHSHRLAPEMQLVRATVEREVLADGKVAAVEIARVVGVDPEAARDAPDGKLRGIRGRDLDPRVAKAERRARLRPSPLPVPTEGAGQQGRR